MEFVDIKHNSTDFIVTNVEEPSKKVDKSLNTSTMSLSATELNKKKTKDIEVMR